MIKVTFEELKAAVPALKRLNEQRLPYKDAVRFSRMVKKIDEELPAYTEQMMKYLKENAVETSTGQFKLNDPVKAGIDLKALGSDIIELNFDKFNLPDYIELQPNDIQFLSPFVNFEE